MSKHAENQLISLWPIAIFHVARKAAGSCNPPSEVLHASAIFNPLFCLVRKPLSSSGPFHLTITVREGEFRFQLKEAMAEARIERGLQTLTGGD